jgi:NTP pyrophosphatase (non-canonical NTP hydrolase)
MNGKDYQAEILRTYAGSESMVDKLTLGALGIAGEAGEVVDHIKKVLYSGHTLDADHLAEELGDVLWYIGLVGNAIDCTLDDLMQLNVEKLRKRYPHGFEAQRSMNR